MRSWLYTFYYMLAKVLIIYIISKLNNYYIKLLNILLKLFNNSFENQHTI